MLLKTAENNGYKKGRKAGIEEVIDWMNQYCENIYSDKVTTTYKLEIPKKDWQTQLKKWGISG